MTRRNPRKVPCQIGWTAVVALVASLSFVCASAANAQTAGSGQGSSAPETIQKPLPGSADDVNALVAQLRSPDAASGEQAAKTLRQGQRAVGHQLLESAKQQVREVQEARKNYTDAAAKLTLTEQDQQVTALQQKAAVASETIRLLGELHVKEALPFLLENVAFEDLDVMFKRWNYPNRFPCLGALITLGLPAADATLRGIEEQSIPRPSAWGEEILARMLGLHGAVGYLQDRIDALKERQRKGYPPVTVAPGKPRPTAISVRIGRLEAIRAHLEASAKEWVGLSDLLKPDMP